MRDLPLDVVTLLVFNEKGELFLMKSPHWSNKYVMCGGKIELHEKSIDTAKREAKEETNMDIYELKLMSISEFPEAKEYYRENNHFISFNYICKAKNNDVKLNEEGSEYVWKEPAKALELDLSKPHRQIIEEYIKFRGMEKY